MFNDGEDFIFVHDYNMTLKPLTVACDALKAMFATGVKNWFAHNGGKYDVCIILEAITHLGYKARGHIAAGRVVSLTITNNDLEQISLYDSYAVIPSALKKIGKDFALKNQKLLGEDDYSKPVQEWTFERLLEGCKADCKVVLEALSVVETMLQHEGGELKSTFSSCAFSVLKSKTTLPDTRDWQPENKLARLAYAGGRVEVFRHTPKETLNEWDVNSSYPWSMSQAALPWRLIGMILNEDKASTAYESGSPCIVEATVDVPPTAIPVLPFRHSDGGIFFPVGKWRGYFVSEELSYAVSTGTRIRGVHSAIAYSAENPFRDFIREFYRLKSEGTGAVRNFYKLILNGCYGKFGQKPEKEVLRIFDSQESAFQFMMERPPESTRVLSNSDMRFIGVEHTIWSKHTHYAIAAFITARSRILLHRHLTKSIRPAYCDTDSIHASADSTLITGEELGELKLEIEGMTGRYYAPKIYALYPENGEPHFASKGFPVDAKTFKQVIAGENVRSERIQLAKRQIRNGNKMARIETVRSWSGISAKRRNTGKGDTEPWEVQDLIANKHLHNMSPSLRKRMR